MTANLEQRALKPCPFCGGDALETDPLTARLSELLATYPSLAKSLEGYGSAFPHRDISDDFLHAAEIVNALPALLAERAILIAEREEARALLEPFAKERLSMEPTVSDCLLRSAGAEMRLAAEKLDARDNAIRAARAYLTKTEADHVTG